MLVYKSGKWGGELIKDESDGRSRQYTYSAHVILLRQGFNCSSIFSFTKYGLISELIPFACNFAITRAAAIIFGFTSCSSNCNLIRIVIVVRSTLCSDIINQTTLSGVIHNLLYNIIRSVCIAESSCTPFAIDAQGRRRRDN